MQGPVLPEKLSCILGKAIVLSASMKKLALKAIVSFSPSTSQKTLS